jgi:hypothetical protein
LFKPGVRYTERPGFSRIDILGSQSAARGAGLDGLRLLKPVANEFATPVFGFARFLF